MQSDLIISLSGSYLEIINSTTCLDIEVFLYIGYLLCKITIFS